MRLGRTTVNMSKFEKRIKESGLGKFSAFATRKCGLK
jgi:hypothetical protein